MHDDHPDSLIHDLHALNGAGPAGIADVYQDGRELRRPIRHSELSGHLGQELLALGIALLTSGNHVWDKKEAEAYLKTEGRILRPANYPEEVPGNGKSILRVRDQLLGVVNLQGRAFLPPIDCPFRAADRELAELKRVTDIIVVDFHAEATAEKQAFGWYLDGRVSAVLGTHTHVQTADERILPGGTAFVTDAGMTGPLDSVIGVKKEQAIARFLYQTPHRFELPKGPVQLNAVSLSIDGKTGKATSIERIFIKP